MTPTETAREIIERLSAMEVECPGAATCDTEGLPIHIIACPSGCKGSGNVPRFEPLRQKCPDNCVKGTLYTVIKLPLKSQLVPVAIGLCQQCLANNLPPEAEWRPLIEDIALGMGWMINQFKDLERPEYSDATITVSPMGFHSEYSAAGSDTTTNLLRAFIQAVEVTE